MNLFLGDPSVSEGFLCFYNIHTKMKLYNWWLHLFSAICFHQLSLFVKVFKLVDVDRSGSIGKDPKGLSLGLEIVAIKHLWCVRAVHKTIL